MSRKRKTILLLLMISVLSIGLPYLKAEVLTIKYGTEAIKLLRNENSWGEYVHPKFYRIIEYSDKCIQLYYVAPNNQVAFLSTFVVENDKWRLDKDKLIWTRTGNGENVFMWPYYLHFS